MRLFVNSLFQNLIAALSFFVMPRPAVSRIRADTDQLIAVFVLSLLVDCGLQWINVSGSPVFEGYGLQFLVFRNVAVLFLLWAAVRVFFGALRTGAAIVVVLVSFATVKLIVHLATTTLGRVDFDTNVGLGVGLFLLALGAFMMYRIIRHLSTLGALRSLGAGCTFGVMLFGFAFMFGDYQSRMWHAADDHTEHDDYHYVNEEKTYYRQPALMRNVADKLQPGVPGDAEYYVIGFGAYARQAVFRREVQSVGELFDTRFGTAGRSINLINSPSTVDSHPIASVSNLKQSLALVSERMNVGEDVLFLFLTSHGSDEHELSVDFPPLRLNTIEPEGLAAILDETPIKWRVVVVSACYSGGFADSLKNENTMVITASAADKTSFGCSNENEFTWFGQAFFDNALRKTRSLERAFELAQAEVAEREARHGYEPSEPQVFVGVDIAAKLADLTAALDDRDAVFADEFGVPLMSVGSNPEHDLSIAPDLDTVP